MRKRPKSRCYGENGEIYWQEEPEPELIEWEEEFGNEADRLAELKAVKKGRHWGRWYLTPISLDTVEIIPNNGKSGFHTLGIYDIGLDRFDETEWLPHIGAKNWCGVTGLKDLADAMAELEAEKMGKLHYGRWYVTDNCLNTIARYPKWECDSGVRSKIFSIPIDRISEDWVELIEKGEYVGIKGLTDLREALEFVKFITPSTCSTK